MEIMKFWNLIKGHLDKEGLRVVMENYPELAAEAREFADPNTRGVALHTFLCSKRG